jgi:Sigma-54 interaction domain
MFAHVIHFESPRREKPFIKVNCAAIPESLMESILFGYEEGAFTGASPGGRKGKFLLAEGGTIFLDEIGELPLTMQAKLLRVLQEKEVEPVGAAHPVPVNVRVLAASNRDLEEMVMEKRFRLDLFYRLHVISLQIPPLRKWKEDIPELAQILLKELSAELGIYTNRITPEAMGCLLNYDWPGNVRELKTDAFAAPVLGTLGSLIIFLTGIAWLNFRKNRLVQNDKENLTLSVNESGPPRDESQLPDFWLSLLPLLLVLAGNGAFTYLILPDWYSEKVLEAYGGIEVDQVLGVWALVLSLTLGILAGILITWVTQKRAGKAWGFKKPDFRQSLTAGVSGSLLAIMNTASEVGFGNVIAGLPGFQSITRALLSMDVNPLFSEALSINILAGITGSASGGMSIALDIMGQKYLELAVSIGLAPEVLHRIASMSAGGMDTLPHNGAGRSAD